MSIEFLTLHVTLHSEAEVSASNRGIDVMRRRVN